MSCPDKKVIFVLGGPGAGKGTQCEKLAEEFGMGHLSAGELLREAAASDTEEGEMLNTIMKEGKIVPMHVTINPLERGLSTIGELSFFKFNLGTQNQSNMTSLLERAMKASPKKVWLIDGFPRKVDQGQGFEKQVKVCDFCFFFDVSEEILTQRIKARAETSGKTGIDLTLLGRIDDNAESLVKRFRTYVETTMASINHFKDQDKL